MNSLHKAVDDYLELRRGLGFKLREYGVCLRELVSFLESKGSSRITTKLALEFATQRQNEKPVSWAWRLTIVRGFASYRTGVDPTTEVPPGRLLPFRSQRAQPYLYTEEEIRRLLEAALDLVTPHKLQPWTYYCLFGLLAVSGMRLGEALNLQPLMTRIGPKACSRSVGRNLTSPVSCLCIHRHRKYFSPTPSDVIKFTRLVGCPTSSCPAMARV